MNVLGFGAAILGGLLVLWLLGGVLLRIGGLLLALSGGFGVGLQQNASGILVLAIGALLWLAGHWHYALRHREPPGRLRLHALGACLARPDPWLGSPIASKQCRQSKEEVGGNRPAGVVRPPQLPERALEDYAGNELLFKHVSTCRNHLRGEKWGWFGS